MADDLAKSGTVIVIRRALEVAQAVYPIPRWLLWLAVVIVAAIVVAVERIDVGKLLKAWHEATKQGPDNSMPPIPMPEEGIPIPPKEWKDGEV